MLQSTLKTERGKQRSTVYCDIYLHFESPNEITTVDKFPETHRALLVFSSKSLRRESTAVVHLKQWTRVRMRTEGDHGVIRMVIDSEKSF